MPNDTKCIGSAFPEVEPIKITYARSYLNEFNRKLTLEEKKYPLSEREMLLINEIHQIYELLDRMCQHT